MPDPFSALALLGYDGWTRHPLRGDASARQFLRLSNDGGETAIAMHTPADQRASQEAFVRIATLLHQNNLAAPEILAASDDLIVMEDLGASDVATILTTHPADEVTLYHSAIDVLLAVQSIPAPSDMLVLTPETGADMLAPFFEFYAPQIPTDKRDEVASTLRTLMAEHTPNPICLSLRDYHAENLIWRSNRNGTDRIGLVDFQDAFLAPAEYDLVSLLRDARRDVSDDLRQEGLRYFAQATGQPETDVAAKAAVLGIQRNLRILGIFARLAQRDGKEGYLALIPRVRQHLLDDLRHPAVKPLYPILTPLLESPA